MTGTIFKQKWFWIVAPLVVIGIVVAVMLTHPREPRYHGKPLSYWIDQLPTTMASYNGMAVSVDVGIFATNSAWILANAPVNPASSQEATNAVNELGEKCLPYLMSRLKAQDPAWKTISSAWAMKMGVAKLPWRQNNILTAGQAVTALDMLGNRAQGVVPELVKLANNKNPYIRAQAAHVLEEIKKAQPTGSSI